MSDQSPEIRLSDTERDAVITQLREASAEGRITLDEFSERSRQVYTAQFPSEIDGLTRDLPVPVKAELVEPELTPTRRVPKADRKRRWFVQVMGGTTRSGRWEPGEPTITLTVMGGQDIDLTQVEADRVVITAITVMGGTDIIVPDGATVDLGGFMLFGASENLATATGDSPMHVTIRAWGGMGACEVRNLSDKERAKRSN